MVCRIRREIKRAPLPLSRVRLIKGSPSGILKSSTRAHRMRKTAKAEKMKELHRVSERIAEIHELLRKTPPVPLPKKIFVGHWRHFAVRADVLRSSIGSQVKKVVDHCDHWVLGKRRDPASYRTSTEVYHSPSESGFQHGQGLRPLTQEQWDAADFPEFFERKWFRVTTRLIRAGTKNIPVKRYFPEIPRHMLEYAYRPAYATAAFEPNGALESELRRLYQIMDARHGWQKLEGRTADEWDLSLRKKKLREELVDREMRTESAESTLG